MKNSPSNAGVLAGVLAFCAWQAPDLITAWRHSPFDRHGGIALLIWLAPLAASFAGIGARPGSGRLGLLLAWLALATCVAGKLADMHFLNHVALALACAALAPQSRLSTLWLLMGLAWMPVLGWLLNSLPATVVSAIRMSMATLAALSVWPGAHPALRRIRP
jgi:hypothetical protein